MTQTVTFAAEEFIGSERYDELVSQNMYVTLTKEAFLAGAEWQAKQTAPAVCEECLKEMSEEREFWARKFEHWAKCQEGTGVSTHRIFKADAWRDCVRVLRDNDRWVPHGVDVARPGGSKDG